MAYAVKEIFYTLQGEGAHAGTPAVFCRFSGCNLWSGREQDRATAACNFCDTDFVGTDGTEGGKYASALALADAILNLWPAASAPLPLAGGAGGGQGGQDMCHVSESGAESGISKNGISEAWQTPRPPLAPPASGRGTVVHLLQNNFLDSQHRFVVLTGGEPLLQLDKPLIDALHDRGFKIAVETNGTLEAPPDIDWICVSPKADNRIKLTQGHELKLVYPQPGVDPASFVYLDFEHFSLQPLDGPEREANIKKTIAYCLQNPLWHLSLQTHKIVGIR